MNVHVWFKHKDASHAPNASQRGDVSSIHPIDAPVGGKMLGSFFPVVMDLIIPCGKDFTIINGKKQWDCPKCPYNNPDECDAIRVKMPVLSTGDILNPPKVLIKQRYKVDIDSIFSAEMKEIILKTEKTELEKTDVLTAADSNPTTKTILIDKSVIVSPLVEREK